MSSQAIQALLDTRLKAYIDGLASNVRPTIQAPGMSVVAQSLPVVRPTFRPNQPRQASLGTSGYNRERGIYQVDCYYPAGDGRATAQNMAEAIAAHFKRGTDLGTTFKVRILSSAVLGMREEPDRISFPVSIEWYADTANP